MFVNATAREYKSLRLGVKLLLECEHRWVRDIVIVVHDLVDDTSGRKLYDAVGHRLDELVVMTCEEHITLVGLERVVERLDTL